MVTPPNWKYRHDSTMNDELLRLCAYYKFENKLFPTAQKNKNTKDRRSNNSCDTSMQNFNT